MKFLEITIYRSNYFLRRVHAISVAWISTNIRVKYARRILINAMLLNVAFYTHKKIRSPLVFLSYQGV